jgi:uncharacterized membrane protein YtjA (UPF0391 family)
MTLLKWALIFFIVSLIAALFGFTGISAASADLARILFYIFLVIFLVLLVLGLMGCQGRARTLGAFVKCKLAVFNPRIAAAYHHGRLRAAHTAVRIWPPHE